jgi:hypothetical protein
MRNNHRVDEDTSNSPCFHGWVEDLSTWSHRWIWQWMYHQNLRSSSWDILLCTVTTAIRRAGVAGNKDLPRYPILSLDPAAHIPPGLEKSIGEPILNIVATSKTNPKPQIRVIYKLPLVDRGLHVCSHGRTQRGGRRGLNIPRESAAWSPRWVARYIWTFGGIHRWHVDLSW